MFNRNSFNPVSFSTIAFNGASTQQDGRSGYWRLFFYQMQEEALKEAPKEKLAEIPLITTRPTKTRKPRVTPRTSPEPIYEPPVITPLGDFTPLTLKPSYLEEAWRITQEVRVMISQMTLNVIKLESDVDDDEEDIELLLLLA